MDSETSRRRVLVLGAAAALLPLTGAAAATRRARGTEVFPAPGSQVFAVHRQGRQVGTQRYDFSEAAGSFTVRYGSELAFSLKNGRAWRYLNLGEEVWRDGWLDSLQTETRRGDQRRELRLQREGEALYGTADSLQISISGYVVTTSLWHRDTPFSQVLLGHEDGRTKVVNVAALGRDTVATPEGEAEARRYALSGELEYNLWYGPGARLLKASWPGPEREIVTLELERSD